jgi:biopolymer transport protein ExbB
MRRRASNFFLILMVGLLAGFALRPVPAYAWWNDDWSLRKKITVDTSATGAAVNDPIGTTPILVRLHVGNFKFDAANQDGSDLRFVAGDDVTPLKFHIEKYDGLLGEAFVWVSMPDLKPGAQTSLWLYYGNKKANPSQDAKGTYDTDTVLVYHFGEHGGPAHDFSAWGNNAQSQGSAVDGSLIGPGLRLDGQATVSLPASQPLAWVDGAAMTWSAWINEPTLQSDATLFSRRDGANALRIGVDNGVPFVEISTSGGTQRTGAGAPLAAGSWHHLAVVTGPQTALYLDGRPYASLAAPLPALASAALLGGDAAAPAAPAAPADGTTPTAAPAAASGFIGELDELEISKVGRPAGFIRVAAAGQSGDPAAKFLAIGGDEQTASWLSGYLAVILKSVTLDGWVVIGILMIMAVISWMVMVDRTAYLNRVSKGNALFLDRFRQVAADLTVLDNDDISGMGGLISQSDLRTMRHSSLYRIYHIGAGEIRHRFVGLPETQSKILSGPSIAAIRAALDSGLVREMQQLNRLMVFLTIAISGGPFLGLLGTVVGVMITFAAIAEAGDVNVNAIAPGIAAALVATVAGLVVAIPALFGYNYLVSRVKDTTSDMQVFVDEFVTKMAEFYRGRSDQRSTIAAE